jgi:hypothetical protein
MTEQEYMELHRRFGGQLDMKQIMAEFEKTKSNNRLGPFYKVKTKLRVN